MAQTIVITGGAGYVGSVVTNRLINEGYNVKVIDSLIFGGNGLLQFYDNINFEFIKEDIRNIEKIIPHLEGASYVINLAAIVGEHLCKKIPNDAYEINQIATKKLIDACKKSKVSNFIFASTCSNYGVIQDGQFATENSPLNPISLYSKTKVESENYVISETDEQMSGTVLRLATVYGLSPRMRFDLLLHELLLDAITKNKISLYGPSYWRPLIHVQDVADAIITVLKSPNEKIKGNIFNVGNSEQNFTKQDLANMIKNEIPTTKIVIEDEKKDLRSYKVSFDKIKEELGYSTKKSVKDGIQEIVSAIRNEVIDYNDIKFSNASFNTKFELVNTEK